MEKKWVSVILTLVLVCCLSAAYAEEIEYVHQIGIGSDPLLPDEAKESAKADAYVSNSHYVTLIDKDLNDGANGDYIYMAYHYKPSTTSHAITGILFLESEYGDGWEPPKTLEYEEAAFRLVSNINLNKHTLNGENIYAYYTTDPEYGPALVEIGVGSSDHPYVIRNTNGVPQDLNAGCEKLFGSVPSIYLYAKPFEGSAHALYYYLNENGYLSAGRTSKQLNNHEDKLTQLPAVPSTVPYGGYTFTFKGWSTSSTGVVPGTVDVSYSDQTTSDSPKKCYAVYSYDATLTYDANGGSNAPAAQMVALFHLNAAGKLTAQQTFTIASGVPAHENPCYEFIGWSTDPNATQPEYTAGQSAAFDSNTTLYAVWQHHHYGTLHPVVPEVHTQETLSPGMSAYYQCAVCMEYFTEAKAPTTIYNLMGETPAHTFENSVCTECGYMIMVGGNRSYVLTYDANGGTGTMQPQRFTAGVAKKLSPNSFTRPGYTFIGWNTAADGSGTSYREDTNFTASSSITLYAQWQAIKGWIPPTSDDLPKTGDSSTPMLWLSMSILSLLGILLLRKKTYSR